MTRSAPPTAGAFVVLDVETAPADEAVALADRRRGEPGERSTLHALTAATVLRFEVGSDFTFAGFSLRSFDCMEQDEGDLVLKLDEELSSAHAAGATLVTFNGAAHDLAMIERRAARHWLFSAGRYPRWRLGSGSHLDLMRDGVGCSTGRWPSLIDACAAFGVAATPVPRVDGEKAIGTYRKSEVDVVATFVLLLYDLAARTGDIAPMLRGWDGLARHLSSPLVRAPHLAPFARHPHVAAARRVIASLAASGR